MFTAPVELRLVAPAEAQSGRDVSLSVVVKNTTDAAVEIDVSAYPLPVGFDVVVYDSQNRAVWRRVSGVIPAMARGLRIDGSSEVRFECVWNGRDLSGAPVPPGVYRLQAILKDVTFGPRELTTALQTLTIRG